MEWTKEVVDREIGELRSDQFAFKRAYDLVHKRIVESNDFGERLLDPMNWAGTQAVLSTLILVIHHVERQKQELMEIAKTFESLS